MQNSWQLEEVCLHYRMFQYGRVQSGAFVVILPASGSMRVCRYLGPLLVIQKEVILIVIARHVSDSSYLSGGVESYSLLGTTTV